MNIDENVDAISKYRVLEDYLGIEFISTLKEDVCVAKMPVNDRNVNPFGFLKGGVTLEMAETLAGIGSITLCPDKSACGLSVTCNHVRPAKLGDVVTATAKIIHKGQHTHVWQVEVYNQEGNLISNIIVTNFVNEK